MEARTNHPSSPIPLTAPVEALDIGDHAQEAPAPGLALCLSGGGYRAMLFHVGTLWRLYETGYLDQLARISSVSGGSITAGVLGLNWSELRFTPQPVIEDFITHIVQPIRRLAGKTIDAASVVGGVLLPGSISDKVTEAYRKHVFGDATLQVLPDQPRFVINATNVQSGVLWRFMKPYMRDYRVGEVRQPTVALAVAVAASSAFPPVLSPVRLEVDAEAYTLNSGTDLQQEPFTTDVVLTDGGVYDNLGLETAWKRYETILVSDAGGKLEAEAEPKHDWARHSYRVLNLIDNQVRSLRKRQLIASYINGDRKGAYWGIRTDISNYALPDSLPCPVTQTLALAEMPTRLKRLEPVVQERLINWGYAVCDAAMRQHVDHTLKAPTRFPYDGGVG
jgi:NTE family protein